MQTGAKALWGIVIVLVSALVAWLLASQYIPSKGDFGTIRIAVSRTPLSTPIYIADALDLFAKAGLDVELVEVIGGKRSFEAVMAGDAEYGTSSDSVMVFKGFKRNDFVNLAGFVQSDNDVKVVTTEDGAIRGASDLIGKPVGVISGSASEYFLGVWLGLSGVETRQVRLVSATPDAMPDLLAKGEVAAVVVWEPYAFETVQQLAGRARVFPTKGLYPLTFNLIARKAYARDHPEVSRRILHALDMAIDHIAQHPRKAQHAMGERLGLKDDFVRWVWADYLFKLSLGRSLLLTLEEQARWALQAGQVQGSASPDFAIMIDPQPLSAVKPSAVTIYR